MEELESYYGEDTSFVLAFLGFFTALLCGLLIWGDTAGLFLIPWYAVFLIAGPLFAGFLVGYSRLYTKSLRTPMLWSALTLLAGLLVGNYMGALWLHRHDPAVSTTSLAVSAAVHAAVALGIGLGGAYYGYLRRGRKDYEYRLSLLPDKDARPPTMSE